MSKVYCDEGKGGEMEGPNEVMKIGGVNLSSRVVWGRWCALVEVRIGRESRGGWIWG